MSLSAASITKIVEWVCAECRRISKRPAGELVDVMHQIEDDLGMDDLDRVELFLAIEDHFGIDFTNVDAGDTPTVGYVCNLVYRALEAKSSTVGSL